MRELVLCYFLCWYEGYFRKSVKHIEVTNRERLEIRKEPRRLYKKEAHLDTFFFLKKPLHLD